MSYSLPLPASLADISYLAQAVLLSERAHLNYGVWDRYFNNYRAADDIDSINIDGCNYISSKRKKFIPRYTDIEMINALCHVIENDKNAPIYYKNYYVVKDQNNINVACACSYIYGPCKFTLSGFKDASIKILKWTENECINAWNSTLFIVDSVSGDSWDNKFIIDSVFTSINARGKNLSNLLMKFLINKAKNDGNDRCYLTCALGNTGAKGLYYKLGFQMVGIGECEECYQVLGFRGFDMFKLMLSKPKPSPSFFSKPVPAIVSDSYFLAQSLVYAERGNSNYGMWDCFINGPLSLKNSNKVKPFSDNRIFDILSHVVEHDVTSRIHYSKYYVIRDSNDDPIACCTSYIYPIQSFRVTPKTEMINATRYILGWTKQQHDDAWNRLSFLKNCCPADIEWDNRLIIECIYVKPEYRRNHLSQILVEHVIKTELSKEMRECLICCMPGHIAARKSYENIGFEYINVGNSQDCCDAIGNQGFEVLKLKSKL